MKKYFLLAALALPMLMMTSCKKDNNENVPEEKYETYFTDGVKYLNTRLFTHDEQGNVTGILLGEFVWENDPTTAYVGVESQEEAQRLASSLFPQGTGVKTADNITFTLTDTLGNKQGCAYYTANVRGADNEDVSYGRLTFDDALGVDKNLLTSIVFIANSLWQSNAAAPQGTLSVGNIYKCEANIFIPSTTSFMPTYFFICTRTPKNGQPGILFADIDNSSYLARNLVTEPSDMARRIGMYPSAYWMSELSKDLNEGGQLYWQQIAACANTTVKTIQSRCYFTHDITNFDVTVCTLGTWSEAIEQVPFGANVQKHYYNASVLYKFTYNNDGTTNIIADGTDYFTGRQSTLSLSDFSLDTGMMELAKTKNPDE